jgi:hypothetical protein
MSCVRTLSERGNQIDYRPPAQHNLFKLDTTFDFRYGAIRHCHGSIDRYVQHVFWSAHKALTDNITSSILQNANDKLQLTMVTSGRYNYPSLHSSAV